MRIKKVLILHKMGDPQYWRESVRSLEYMVPECMPDLRVIVHNSVNPIPNYIKKIEFDLIILGSTFLDHRYNEKNLSKIKKHYDFIANSCACKIAMPQDDYDGSAKLDTWFQEWKVNLIYTVCPDYWEELYPISHKNIEIRLGFTGYISEDWVQAWKNPKPFDDRKIDVSYRATKLIPLYGRLGDLKSNICEMFISAIGEDKSLNLDMSVDPNDLIPGIEWHKFLEESKFCLGVASGSSLHDPYNKIRKTVLNYISNDDWDYQKVADNCYPEGSDKLTFTAISPRNIEAALSKTVQINTPASYSGILLEKRDYFPIAENCSNIQDVMEFIKNRDKALEMSDQCKKTILNVPRLRRNNIVKEILLFAENHQKNVTVSGDYDDFFNKYNTEFKKIEDLIWKRNRIINSTKNQLRKLGAHKFKKYIKKY